MHGCRLHRDHGGAPGAIRVVCHETGITRQTVERFVAGGCVCQCFLNARRARARRIKPVVAQHVAALMKDAAIAPHGNIRPVPHIDAVTE